MNDSLLMVFVKNLIPGMVKTRLAKDIGIDAALNVYMELVFHTNEVADKIAVDKAVYYSEYVEIEDVWDTEQYSLGVQKGKDLGEKMTNAFDEAFDSYIKVIIIGSDCYELTPKIVNDAYTELEGHDLVVGPAKDGGYYLLGMKEYYPQLFQNKKYGTDTVLEDLLIEAANLDLSVFELPILSDIDTFDDLKESGIDWENLGQEEFDEEEPGLEEDTYEG
ncbi:MAG: TIGR04282 family arsenosugar biosynthesis glycosyltransferase [Bacteroidota bacterium]